MTIVSRVVRMLFVFLAGGWTPPIFAAEEIRLESVIIFNTACARCHEGECSGRLTFHLPRQASDTHIQRYSGKTDPSTTRQLFRLLGYMKAKCSFYPLPKGLSHDRSWNGAVLRKLRSPTRRAYFVPLGVLAPGRYRLLIDGVDNNPCLEIITSEFDYLDTNDETSRGGEILLSFQVERRLAYFLRVTARKPLDIKRIELSGSDKPDRPG